MAQHLSESSTDQLINGLSLEEPIIYYASGSTESITLEPMRRIYENFKWLPEKTVTMPWYYRMFGVKTRKYPSGWYYAGLYEPIHENVFSHHVFVSDDEFKSRRCHKNHIADPEKGIFVLPCIKTRTVSGDVRTQYFKSMEEAVEVFKATCMKISPNAFGFTETVA